MVLGCRTFPLRIMSKGIPICISIDHALSCSFFGGVSCVRSITWAFDLPSGGCPLDGSILPEVLLSDTRVVRDVIETRCSRCGRKNKSLDELKNSTKPSVSASFDATS
jgi:hypothetical protein